MHFRLHKLVLVIVILCSNGLLWGNTANELLSRSWFFPDPDDNSLFYGGKSTGSAVNCQLMSSIGDDASIYKGGDAPLVWMGVACKTDNILDPNGVAAGGIFKGGDASATVTLIYCAPVTAFSEDESTPFTGGVSYDQNIACGLPVILSPGDERVGIYKGSASNDLFVNCLEKPAIIDVMYPMYQGGRSYLEILDCGDIYQLGKGGPFAGGASRSIAVSCEILQTAGGGAFFGGDSRSMTTATSCYELPESLTDMSMFRGGNSSDELLDCEPDISLGEPTGGYYRGGNSSFAAIDCYDNPCLQLLPATITASGAVPICIGKQLILTASPADSRKWQRYESGNWTDYSADPSITLTQSGDFRLISFGSAGCSDTSRIFNADFVVSIPQPVITVEGSATICQGGRVALRSTPSYKYLWSTGEQTQTIWVTQAGNYQVTITDQNGCSATSGIVEMFDGSDAAPFASVTPNGKTEICEGSSQAFTANEASAYHWSNGAITRTINVSEAGKYAVRITDINGCEATSDSVELVVYRVKPVISYQELTVCYGTAVELSVAPHTTGINWYKDNSPLGLTSTRINVTDAGMYHVVLDTLGCSFASDQVEVITNGSGPGLADITASHHVLCQGGGVTLTAGDASKYEWSNGDNAQSIWVNAPGTYTLTVEDAFGCSSSDSYTVNQVPVTINPVVNPVSGNLDLCPGNSVVLSVSEGNSFDWSSGETTQQITVSTPGTYSAIVADANGCEVTTNSVEVTMYAEEKPVIDTGRGVICGNEPLNLTVMNAASYLWSTGETASGIDVLTAGAYWVTITTTDGCEFTSPVVNITKVAAPAIPVISVNAPYLIAQDTVWICPNQEGDVTLTSTVADEYEWSTGETSRSITPAATGKFAVLTFDSNTCPALSDTVVIAMKDRSVSLEADSDELGLCPGGSITLKVIGGAGSTFRWNDHPAWTGDTFVVTSAGEYYATVFGSGGCIENTDTIEIYNYPSLKPYIIPQGSTDICVYDSVKLDASVGESYNWVNSSNTTLSDESFIYVKDAGTFYVDVTDEYGCTQRSDGLVVTQKLDRTPVLTADKWTICQKDILQISAPAEGVDFLWSTGETTRSITYDKPSYFGETVYWAEITYNDGCTFKTPEKTLRVVQAPREPVITVVGSNQICPDQSVALVATQSDNYTYLWSTGETSFSIVVVDNDDYEVTVTDVKTGCSSTSEILHLTSLSSARVEIQPEGPVSLCEKGWAMLEAFASEQNVTYKWNTGETTKSIIVNQNGYYRVTATNQDDCSVVSKNVAVHEMSAVPPPQIVADGALTFCEGGRVTLTSSISPSGQYEWYRNRTEKIGDAQSVEVWESGIYTVVISDKQGCLVSSREIRVTVNPLPETDINPYGVLTICSGGTIQLSAPEGTGYSYLWTPGNIAGRQINASIGIHKVKVTTAQGCSATSLPVEIKEAYTQASVPDIGPTGTCAGEKAVVTASSPIANPEYKWWDAASGGLQIGSGPTFETQVLNASYTIWVSVSSDAFCESPRRQVTILVGPKVPVSFTTGDFTVCNYDPALSLAATPAGGIFSGAGVSGSGFDPSLTGPGDHTLYYTVINNGCPSVDSVTVTVKPSPQIIFQNVPAGICSNESPVLVDVSPANGILTGPGVTGLSFDPFDAGPGTHQLTYKITEGGCVSEKTIGIEVLAAPVPVIDPTVSSMELTDSPVELKGTPVNGIFTGTGVTQSGGKYYFDPSVAGLGIHVVTYTVDDGKCQASTSIYITVVECIPVDTGPMYRIPNKN